MYSVDIYSRVPRACLKDGMSAREAARYFNKDRKTIAKMLRHELSPGYRRSEAPRRPTLDDHVGVIDEILRTDKTLIKKQRHTAKRIFEHLRDEHDYVGSQTTVTYYVREQKRRTKEVFVPLSHRPGHAQVDFGETTGVIGGIPQSILYDNTKIAVARILGDKTRIRTRRLTELQSHYLFDDKFGRPARGNDKGNVEGMVGYTRRNFMVPAPRYDSFDDLNAHLEQKCLERQGDTLRGHTQTIGARLMSDLDALIGLPVAEYEACDHVSTRATSISMVRYRSNDYSVPVACAHHDIHVRGFAHEVIIGCGNEIIARHKRSYASADMIFDPIHFLPLIEQKVGALDQAAPLQGWDLPDVFAILHRLLEARMGKPGKREYVQVLRLLETFEMSVVQGAISQAIDMGAIGYDAVKHLVLCRVEKRPPRLDLDF